jgi:hypothetical protein
MVGTQMLLLWLNLQVSFCCRPAARTLNKTTDCLFPCLHGAADALPGMGNNNANQFFYVGNRFQCLPLVMLVLAVLCSVVAGFGWLLVLKGLLAFCIESP